MDVNEMDAMKRNISKVTSKESITIIRAHLDDRLRELIAIEHSEGKIYMIVHKVSRKLAYIGSTTQPLKLRFGGHKSFLKQNVGSKYANYILKHGGIDCFEMQLIEAYPCDTRDQLVDREKQCIIAMQPPCNTYLTRCEAIELETGVKKDQGIEPICPKCGWVAQCSAKLEKHLGKKNPCDQGKFRCNKCRFRTNNRSSLYTHRRSCKGISLSKTELVKKLTEFEQSKIKSDSDDQKEAKNDRPFRKSIADDSDSFEDNDDQKEEEVESESEVESEDDFNYDEEIAIVTTKKAKTTLDMPSVHYKLSYQEAKDLENTKIKVAKKLAKLEQSQSEMRITEAKELMKLRMQEKKLDIAI